MARPLKTDQLPETWSLSSVSWSFVRGMIDGFIAVALAFVITTSVLWFAGSSWLTLLHPRSCSTDPGYDAKFERVIPRSPRSLDVIERPPFHSRFTTASSRLEPSAIVTSGPVGGV